MHDAVEGAPEAGGDDDLRAVLSSFLGDQPLVETDTTSDQWNALLDAAETLVRERVEAADAVIEAVGQGMLSHTTGGDQGMVFDEFDAAEERTRRGHWAVDDRAMDKLIAYRKTKREAVQ